MATRILLFFLACFASLAQITNVSIGSNPNDGAGDTLRTAFSKVNTNVAWLAGQLGSATNSPNFTTNATVAGADVATKVNTIAALRLLSPKTDEMLVDVLGYYSAGDGGGGKFWIDTSDTSTPDDGGSVIVCANGYRAKAIFDESIINVKRFGAKPDFDVSTWSGTDNSTFFQAAVDFSESTQKVPTVFIPAGIYGLNSIRVGKSSLMGERTSSSATVSYGSALCHVSGATNDMVLADRSDYGFEQTYAEISNINFIGSYERNLKNPKPITAVTSRTVFRVATTNLPTATSVANWPFYGFAFFYTSEGQYLGSAVVQSIDSGTGDVTIAGGWANYATKSAASGLLTTSEQVVFSPATTSLLPELPAGLADSSSAGYAAISCLRTGFKRISNCSFRFFHVGIRQGVSLVIDLRQCWFAGCAFAGYASVGLGYGSDNSWDRVFAQGQYSANYGKTYTNTLDDTAYQKTAFGFYGPGSRTTVSDATSDECVHGLLDAYTSQVDFRTLLCDKPVKEAIVSFGGNAQNTALSIVTLQISTPNFTLPTNISYVSGSRTAILLGGGVARYLAVNNLDVVRFSGAPSTNDFINLARAVSPNELFVLNLRSISGYTNISSVGNYPRFSEFSDGLSSATLKRYGSFRKSSTDVGISANGSEGVTISAASVGANPTVGIGNTVSITSREGVDLKKAQVAIGLDQANRSLRTDLSTHEGWLVGIPYDMSQSGVAGIGIIGASSLNGVYLGGGLSDRQAATRIDFYAATSVNTLSGTLMGRFDGTTSSTTTGLLLNYNGVVKRVEVGAADSGGVGYRVLRISN